MRECLYFRLQTMYVCSNDSPHTMEKQMRLSFLAFPAAAILISLPSGAVADSNPIQLALFNPVQIVPEGSPVEAFRFSLIYGRNVSVTGLDLGLVNMSTGGTSKGIQWGFIGINQGNFTGWQGNFISISSGTMQGLQTGLYTQSHYVSGLQFGLLNMTDTMYGIQLGLLNFIGEGGFLPVFPIVNWSFREP